MDSNFIQAIAESIQAVVGFAGLLAILILYKQIKSDSEWRRKEEEWKKISMSLGKFDSLLYYDNFNSVKEYLDINEDEESICKVEFEEIIDERNTNILDEITKILNMSDELAVLYNLKLLDKNIVYELYGSKIILIYLKFKKIIEYYREETGNSLKYKHLEKCAEDLIKERKKKKS